MKGDDRHILHNGGPRTVKEAIELLGGSSGGGTVLVGGNAVIQYGANLLGLSPKDPFAELVGNYGAGANLVPQGGAPGTRQHPLWGQGFATDRLIETQASGGFTSPSTPVVSGFFVLDWDGPGNPAVPFTQLMSHGERFRFGVVEAAGVGAWYADIGRVFNAPFNPIIGPPQAFSPGLMLVYYEHALGDYFLIEVNGTEVMSVVDASAAGQTNGRFEISYNVDEVRQSWPGAIYAYSQYKRALSASEKLAISAGGGSLLGDEDLYYDFESLSGANKALVLVEKVTTDGSGNWSLDLTGSILSSAAAVDAKGPGDTRALVNSAWNSYPIVSGQLVDSNGAVPNTDLIVWVYGL